MKSGVRFVAIATSPIQNKRRTMMIGIVAREHYIEGILSNSVEVNGKDATARIIRMIATSRFREQIKIVVLNGIALAGLNVVDTEELEKSLKIKYIVFTRKKPSPKKLIHALDQFGKKNKIDVKDRISIIKSHAKIKPVAVDNFHLQSTLDKTDIKNFADKAYEALRIAHLIASGVDRGESKGRV